MEQNQSMKKWYQIVPNPQNDNDEQQAFRITEGKFQDVIYKYNRFGVNEEPNDDGTLTYKFEYDILEIPEEIVDKKITNIAVIRNRGDKKSSTQKPTTKL